METPTKQSVKSELDTFSAIEQRRSVKHYDPKFEMPEEDVQKLISLAMLSPTSFNIQNWRFLHVKEPALRQQLRQAAWDQAQVTEASTLLILCADLKAWEKNPARYWQNAPQGVQDFMVPALGDFYRGKEELQRDEAMRSCGIAGQTLMLAAKAMGYDSNPMIGFDPTAVGTLINLPEDHVIAYILVIGKAIKKAQNRGGQLPVTEVLTLNHF